MNCWEKDLYDTIIEYKPKSILEIGSADGSVSTNALLKGIKDSKSIPSEFYCFEYIHELYDKLKERSSEPWFQPFKFSTLQINKWMSLYDVITFYKNNSPRNVPPINLVLDWYLKSTIYLVENPTLNQDGIEYVIKKRNSNVFDLVLIDGGPFSGFQEYELLSESKVIILDDIHDIKCLKVFQTLSSRKDYKLKLINESFCNGYCIFHKI